MAILEGTVTQGVAGRAQVTKDAATWRSAPGGPSASACQEKSSLYGCIGEAAGDGSASCNEFRGADGRLDASTTAGGSGTGG